MARLLVGCVYNSPIFGERNDWLRCYEGPTAQSEALQMIQACWCPDNRFLLKQGDRVVHVNVVGAFDPIRVYQAFSQLGP